ncbi:P-loop containing nucleoside triphosphate hydrolase protein [Polychytrium aggregatum]|uniref:P-loop containing nucleoside triphosphate hydrolase protein n=1 Tax=Polychytrium aggregatum TaxID=110093 RepID=UPI0022FE1B90|nr:P-loop containing nucleoside triphosphate hydrolase protein [Polychytrium aggregatum]KAI9204657.1 P-loop containing nucleoside triphosphate hydrolase protein [Polychytrium aggregatum]
MADAEFSEGIGVGDMTTLTELTEEAIMENLRIRYDQRRIYTFTGSILVAMNPFENLEIYSLNNMKTYQAKRLLDRPPHIFAIAEQAYGNVKNGKGNQAVIISGESGAGKSESTKLILQYLTFVTSTQSQESWVEQQILEANTVLESFGNAKTVRNNNSSRFGKFIQIHFDKNTRIIGAGIINYLLEKSRVVKQAKTERNYHVFYELLRGSNEDERSKYSIEDPEAYYYMSQSGCIDLHGVSDEKNFEKLKLAFTVLKMETEDIESTMRTLSAILWVGNIAFDQDAAKDNTVSIKDRSVVDLVAKLLGVNAEKLAEALCFRRLVVRGDVTMVPLKGSQATDNRDSIAKAIYDNLFQRIVEFINQALKTKQASAKFVGVLDIFGFEDFAINSFEQFCINYTNEKLQQFFNQFIFKLEQEEYDKEAIKWSKITFTDNQLCLDLIEAKPAGVLALLDEETKFPKGSDDGWLQKMDQGLIKNPHYVKARTQKGVFGVKHYAGTVTYVVVSFLEKNKDAIQDEIYDLLRTSSYKLVARIFPQKAEEPSGGGKGAPAGKAGGKITAGAYFRNQLVSLVTTLGSTMPHYVRCIKPNMQKEAFVFDDQMVLSQLRYSGMLDTIRIRKAGYPMRLPFDQIPKSYKCLIPPGMSPKDNPQQLSVAIMSGANISSDLWQCGKTKLFMRMEAMEALQAEADKIMKVKILLIQRVMRGYVCKKKYTRMRASIKVIQKFCVGFYFRRRYLKIRKAVILIQSVVRGWFARDYYRTLLEEKRKADKEAQELAKSTQAAFEKQKAASDKKNQSAEEEQQLKQFAIAAKTREHQTAVAATSKQPAAKEGVPPKPAQAPNIAKAGRPEALKEGAAASAVAGTAEPQAVSEEAAPLDNLFSFLGDYDNAFAQSRIQGADILAQMAAELSSEIDSLFTSPPKRPAPPPAQVKAIPSSKSIGSQLDLSKGSQVAPNIQAADTIESGAPPAAEPIDIVLAPPPPPPPKQMRSNPLAKKANEEMGSLTSLEGKVQDDYLLEIFAEKNFETHYRPLSAFATISKKIKMVPIELSELLKYSKTPIQMSLTKMPERSDLLVNAAIECFKLLLKCLDPSSKKQDDFSISIQAIMEYGIKFPELRDEILVQICKQVSVPKEVPSGWDQIQTLGWRAMVHATASLPPTKALAKYLNSFLQRSLEDIPMGPESKTIRKLCIMAGESVKNCLMNGPRRYSPSSIEINAVKASLNATSVPCSIQLIDGQSHNIEIALTEIASGVIKEIAKTIDLKEIAGWSLYEVSWKSERAVRTSDYIMDILAGWEHGGSSSTSPTGTSASKDSKKVFQMKVSEDAGLKPVFNVDSNIVLKKRIFKNINEPILDPVEYNLLYCQAVDNYTKDVYPVNEKTAMQLAACRAQALMGDCDKETARDKFTDVESWIVPRLVANLPRDEWIDGIVSNYEKIRGTSSIQAKVLFLETCKTFRAFATAFFNVRYKGFWSFAENIQLAVSFRGIDFIHIKTKQPLMQFDFKHIKGFDQEGDLLTLSLTRVKEDGDAETLEVYKFVTSQSEEIVGLIREYAPTSLLTIAKKKIEVKVELSLKSLLKDIEAARATLLARKIMKRTDKSETMSILSRHGSKASLKNLTKMLKKEKRMSSRMSINMRSDSRSSSVCGGAEGLVRFASSDALRDEPSQANTKPEEKRVTKSMENLGIQAKNAAETSEYAVQEWECSKHKIISALSTFKEVDDEWALMVNTAILQYGGLKVAVDPSENQRAPVAETIQSIIENCLDTPILINELYLQLIKQTTNHIDLDQQHTLAFWKLMAVVTGVAAPTVPEVFEYLKAHLRRYSFAESKDKGTKSNESEYAKHCLKTVLRTASAGPRRCPPSLEEMQSSERMAPLRIRIYFLDGQFRALPVGSVDTMQQMFAGLVEKIKLKNATGFSIYEEYAGTERSLRGDEKMADILYNWEKTGRKAGGERDRVRLIFKKRVFVDPPGHVVTEFEEQLLMYQASEDIRRDVFPITVQEAAEVVAMQAQALYGDSQSTQQAISYWPLIEAHVPARLREQDMTERIALKHAALAGLSRTEALGLLMDFVRSWALFGSAVFDVTQSYTNQLPSGCWLAVNKGGVHILPKHEKVPLATYEFKKIVSYSPSDDRMLFVMDNKSGAGEKYVFQTTEAHQIGSLIKDYIECLSFYGDGKKASSQPRSQEAVASS